MIIRPRNLGLIAGILTLGAMTLSQAPLRSLVSPSCNIRGNVSAATGERIYHLPGQSYYDQTVVKPWRGERWFCSETEAQQTGWRRSRV